VLGAVLSHVVGIGMGSTATATEVAALVRDALSLAGCEPGEVVAVATIDTKAAEPAIASLGWPVVAFPAAELQAVTVPHPSGRAAAATGTASVAEAAALLAAGAGAELVVTKRASPHATVAVARQALR
jgi:cobalamin biosynthesis protein CbiG